MRGSVKWLSLLFVLAVGAFGYARLTGAAGDGWEVGELRENGLRIIPGGRSDAGAVLDPGQFPNPRVRHAYWVATRIPETLNQLYCWCGCVNRGVHRSNLECFEDLMAVNCDVCRGTAEIAYDMVTNQGIENPGLIQRAVDEVWAPAGTELWEPAAS
ncbi:MAG: hypothetical protein ACREMD_07075 [Gemmatimonadota bacterium]